MGSPLSAFSKKPDIVLKWLNIYSLTDPIIYLGVRISVGLSFQVLYPLALVNPSFRLIAKTLVKSGEPDEQMKVSGGHGDYWDNELVHEKIVSVFGGVSAISYILFIWGKKKIEELDPIEIIDLMNECLEKGDKKKLSQIILHNSDKELINKINLFKNPGASINFKYHNVHYLNNNIAEVSVSIVRFYFLKVPFNKILLRKIGGIWKVDSYKVGIMNEEELEEFYRGLDIDTEYYLNKASIAENAKEYEKAIKFYTNALRLDVDGFWDSRMDEMMDYCILSLNANELDNYYKIEGKKKDGNYYYAKGLYERKQTGDYEKALQYFNRALEVGGVDRSRIKVSIDSVKGLIKEDMENKPDYLVGKGWYFKSHAKNYKKAIEYYQRALQVDPNGRHSKEAREGIVECERLLKEQEKKEVKEADAAKAK
ncbi:MAG: hypothetical protein Q8P81_02495 [Nanoarchaeota archaeon]|nr:hypothetical protein [Nanoarchaeota archaeon]